MAFERRTWIQIIQIKMVKLRLKLHSPCIMCVQYIGGKPLVHWGDIMSTSGVFSTSGEYHDACGGYHEYIRGCSIHRGIP